MEIFLSRSFKFWGLLGTVNRTEIFIQKCHDYKKYLSVAKGAMKHVAGELFWRKQKSMRPDDSSILWLGEPTSTSCPSNKAYLSTCHLESVLSSFPARGVVETSSSIFSTLYQGQQDSFLGSATRCFSASRTDNYKACMKWLLIESMCIGWHTPDKFPTAVPEIEMAATETD